MGTPKKGRNGWLFVSLAALIAATSIFFIVKRGDSNLDSCPNTMTVEVRERSDSSSRTLYLVDGNGKEYRPLIDAQGVVITAGRKMTVCHRGIDTLADGNLSLHIVRAINLP